MAKDYSIEGIIQAFEIFDGHYKRKYVNAALQRRDEIIPHLIAILEKICADPDPYANDLDYFGASYAVMLLGHFEATEAHQAIVDFVSLPPDYPSMFLGDTITEELAAILYRTCGGSLESIKELVLNKTAYDWCRSAAARALTYAVAEGIVARDDILAFLGPLFTGDEADRDSAFWEGIAFSILELHPLGMIDTIQWAMQRGLISDFAVTLEEFEEQLEIPIEAALEGLRAELQMRSPANFHDSMSWWACFN